MVTSSGEHDLCNRASIWHQAKNALDELVCYKDLQKAFSLDHLNTASHTHTHVLPGCSSIQMADRILTTSTIMCGTLGLIARTRRGIPSGDVSMALRPC